MSSLRGKIHGHKYKKTGKEGWSVIVTRAKEPELWLPVLRTLLTEEIKGRRNQLEYLDLRFGNKVFYKFR